jgi:hypothetical protein
VASDAVVRRVVRMCAPPWSATACAVALVE